MSRVLISRSLRLAQPTCAPRIATRATRLSSCFHTSAARSAAANLNPNTISAITEREKLITNADGPVPDGPTAQAQRHAGQPLTSAVISDIMQGEQLITGLNGPIAGGPAAYVQKIADVAATGAEQNSGVLDSATISAITDAEKRLTGSDEPVKGGPTAQAQKHANEPINPSNLHDITEGEKKITGGERVKGGPTATAQSELSRSRSNGHQKDSHRRIAAEFVECLSPLGWLDITIHSAKTDTVFPESLAYEVGYTPSGWRLSQDDGQDRLAYFFYWLAIDGRLNASFPSRDKQTVSSCSDRSRFLGPYFEDLKEVSIVAQGGTLARTSQVRLQRHMSDLEPPVVDDSPIFCGKYSEATKTNVDDGESPVICGRSAMSILEMNVQNDKSVQTMGDFVVKKFGRLDYGVNAAGISRMPSSSKCELAELVFCFSAGLRNSP
ncbi:hypothetical protein SCUP515_07546 [Seiridium cupressi]